MCQPDIGDEVEVVGDDRGFATLLECHEAVDVHLGDLGVRRVVVADRGDVTDRAVGVMDQNDGLLGLGWRVENAVSGQDLELDRLRGRGIILGAFGDPVAEKFIGLGSASQPETALVGDLAERLAEDHAGVGIEGVDPSPAGLPAEDLVILVRQVAPKAEAEPTLAGGSAVAGSHVAASLAERWDDVVAEAHRRGLPHLLDLDGHLGLDTAAARDDRRGAIAHGNDLSGGGDLSDFRVQADPLQGPCKVAHGTVGVVGRGDELLGRSTAGQGGVGRLDGHRRRCRDQVHRVLGAGGAAHLGNHRGGQKHGQHWPRRSAEGPRHSHRRCPPSGRGVGRLHWFRTVR